MADKEAVLISASKLRKSSNAEFRSVFINQDITAAQIVRLKDLRAELKK